MQLLIDTDTIQTAELGATVVYLDDLLRIRRKADGPQPAATNEQTADVTFSAPPPPPPAPLSLADIVSEDDVEVEIDDAGNIQSVAAVVELPAAPPPPLPPPGVSPTFTGTLTVPPAIPSAPGPVVPAELDKRGMPYDARIHASNRAKKLDGAWKNKRGVDPNLVIACEAQNKPGNAPSTAIALTAAAPAIMAAPAPPAAPTAPPAPPPPPPTVGSVAPPAVAPSAIDFRGLMQKIQAATAGGKLTADQVNAALAGVGLRPEEMAALINNAPLIASVNSAIDACLGS